MYSVEYDGLIMHHNLSCVARLQRPHLLCRAYIVRQHSLTQPAGVYLFLLSPDESTTHIHYNCPPARQKNKTPGRAQIDTLDVKTKKKGGGELKKILYKQVN